MSRASKTSRISPASSGCCSQYSLMVGLSPRLQRARNSSASNPTGPRSSLEEDIALMLQGTHVPIAGGRGLDAEHLGGLVIGELLEMPQGQDLPVDRVQGVA